MLKRAATRLLLPDSSEVCRACTGAAASVGTTACSDQDPSTAASWHDLRVCMPGAAVRSTRLSPLHPAFGMSRHHGLCSAPKVFTAAMVTSTTTHCSASSMGNLRLCSTSTTSEAVSASLPDIAARLLAASPLEAFTAMPAPAQLSIQAWELVHLGVGLPWWLSIPLTTLMLRTLLLPFTLKAKAASVNFSLWGHAFGQASQALAKEGQSAPVPMRDRLRAANLVYRYMKSRHRTPSTWWYLGNSLVQVPTFILLSFGLRRMCDIQWPGLSGEGFLFLQDLSAPSVVAATWATPYGPYGLFLPLAIFATYTASLRFSAAARTPAVATALESISLPYLCAAIISPQALQLYWLSNSAFHLGLQALLSKPQVARALKLPMMLVQPRNEADAQAKKDADSEDVQELVDASSDPELLQLLAHDQMSAGHPLTAATTFLKVLELKPGHLPSLAGAALAFARAQEFKKAAEMYQQVAEASTTTADKARYHSLAAINFLEASVGTTATASTPQDESQPTEASSSSQSSSSPEFMRLARTAADKAITLEPYTPNSHLSKAYVELVGGATSAAYTAVTRCLELAVHTGDPQQQTAQSSTGSSEHGGVGSDAAGAGAGSASKGAASTGQGGAASGDGGSSERLRVLKEAVALGERVANRMGDEDEEKRSQLEGLLAAAREAL